MLNVGPVYADRVRKHAKMDRKEDWPVVDIELVTKGLVAYEPAGTIVHDETAPEEE